MQEVVMTHLTRAIAAIAAFAIGGPQIQRTLAIVHVVM
jgi:hypothetical protein